MFKYDLVIQMNINTLRGERMDILMNGTRYKNTTMGEVISYEKLKSRWVIYLYDLRQGLTM